LFCGVGLPLSGLLLHRRLLKGPVAVLFRLPFGLRPAVTDIIPRHATPRNVNTQNNYFRYFLWVIFPRRYWA